MGKTASLAGVFLLVATLIAVVGASSQFTVGDDQGWRQPDANDTGMYTRWASKIRFQIGDSIYFQYTNDSVLLVDKKDYYHCNTTNPIADFKDGKTVVKLDRSGQFYFISGLPDHCKKGQRLVVEVLTSHTPPSLVPPPGPWTDSPAPSPMPSSAISYAIPTLYTIFTAISCWALYSLK